MQNIIFQVDVNNIYNKIIKEVDFFFCLIEATIPF